MSDTVRLQGILGKETEKAILMLRIDAVDDIEIDTKKNEWFPLSQVKSMTHQPPGSSEQDVLEVTKWIASTKGLI